MSLIEDLAELRKPRTFDRWLATANEPDRDAVLEAIRDHSIPENALATLLRDKYGIPVTRETIVRRRGSES